jgi:hypothetical protein
VVYRIRNVQLVKKWVAVLGHRSGEHDDFVDFANALEEGVDTGAFNDVDVVVLAFDFYRNSKVGLVENLMKRLARFPRDLCRKHAHLEATVNQSLIQVKYQALLSTELFRYGWQQPLLCWLGSRHSAGFLTSMVRCNARTSSQDACAGTSTDTGNDASIAVLVVYLSLGQRRWRWEIYAT